MVVDLILCGGYVCWLFAIVVWSVSFDFVVV